MTVDHIHVKASAVATIETGLVAYEREFAAGVEQVRRSMRAIFAECQMIVVNTERALLDAQRALDIAKYELAQCREQDSRHLVEKVRRCEAAALAAKHRAERHRKAQISCNRAIADLTPSLRELEASSVANVKAARETLLKYMADLSKVIQSNLDVR